MRPDRIVVGEVRGGEALDLLLAMNTGHDGSLATVHANSPADALRRIETMALMGGLELPHVAVRESIASAIHVVVHRAAPDGRRRVREVAVRPDGRVDAATGAPCPCRWHVGGRRSAALARLARPCRMQRAHWPAASPRALAVGLPFRGLRACGRRAAGRGSRGAARGPARRAPAARRRQPRSRRSTRSTAGRSSPARSRSRRIWAAMSSARSRRSATGSPSASGCAPRSRWRRPRRERVHGAHRAARAVRGRGRPVADGAGRRRAARRGRACGATLVVAGVALANRVARRT